MNARSRPGRHSRVTRHGLVLALAACAVGLGMAAEARAATIDGLTPEGEAVEDMPWALIAQGRTERPLHFSARIKPAGGRPCGASDGTDDGARVSSSVDGVSGAWTARATVDPANTATAGDYVVCAWLQSWYTDPVALAATSITVHARPPRATLALAAPTRPVAARSPVTIGFQGNSEIERGIYARIKRADGAACGPGYAADTGGDPLVFWHKAQGAFSFSKATNPLRGSGAYLVCAWLAESADDPQPEAAAQVTFAVLTCAQAHAVYAKARRGLRVAQRSLSRARRARPRRPARVRRLKRTMRTAKRRAVKARAGVRASCSR